MEDFKTLASPTPNSKQMSTSRSETSTNQAWKRVEGLILVKGCEGFLVNGWGFAWEKKQKWREGERGRRWLWKKEGEKWFSPLSHTTHICTSQNYTPSPNFTCVNQINPNQHLTQNVSTLNYCLFIYFFFSQFLTLLDINLKKKKIIPFYGSLHVQCGICAKLIGAVLIAKLSIN